MQKKLIALAIAGLATSPAFAQVALSGSIDMLFGSMTNDNQAADLNGQTIKTGRIVYAGSEDLGGGLKANFRFEERINFDSGTDNAGVTSNTSFRFSRDSRLGLSGGFGEVNFGRVPTALDMIFGGGKIANVDTIADARQRKGSRADDRVNNGIQYITPAFGPVKIFTHLALKENQAAAAPYGLAAAVTVGGGFIEAGYQRDGAQNAITSTSTNQFKNVVLNGGYKFGSANVYLAYAKNKGYSANGAGVPTNTTSRRYVAGADLTLSSAGKLYFTLTNGKELNAGAVSEKFTKFGLAYVHSLSKRTQLIAATSYEKREDGSGNGQFSGEKTQLGLQGGLRHAF